MWFRKDTGQVPLGHSISYNKNIFLVFHDSITLYDYFEIGKKNIRETEPHLKETWIKIVGINCHTSSWNFKSLNTIPLTRYLSSSSSYSGRLSFALGGIWVKVSLMWQGKKACSITAEGVPFNYQYKTTTTIAIGVKPEDWKGRQAKSRYRYLLTVAYLIYARLSVIIICWPLGK